MFTATKDKILPTTVTGSWPRPEWYDTDSGGERFAICMTESRFRERFKDATSVVISDQEQAGLDILTNGDYHLDPEMAGRSWLHYPLDRIGGLSQDDFTPPTEALYEYPKGTLLNEIMAQGWMLAEGPRQAHHGQAVRLRPDLGAGPVAHREAGEVRDPSPHRRWPTSCSSTPMPPATSTRAGLGHGPGLLNRELRRLADAGCTVIQIEEPAPSTRWPPPTPTTPTSSS